MSLTDKLETIKELCNMAEWYYGKYERWRDGAERCFQRILDKDLAMKRYFSEQSRCVTMEDNLEEIRKHAVAQKWYSQMLETEDGENWMGMREQAAINYRLFQEYVDSINRIRRDTLKEQAGINYRISEEYLIQ